MTRPPNIALLIELSSAHARGLLRGISAYSQAKGPWRLHLIEQLRLSDIRRALDTWDGDGLIARVETDAIAKVLVERGLPVVNVTGTNVVAPWPRVDTDNDAVCRTAAGHLIDRGYHHFGFCGMAHYQWSGWRRDYFAAELRRQGMSCSILELASLTSDTRLNRSDGRRLARWIANLPRPVGIMACNDHCGRAVLDVCSGLAIPVPDDIGVVGVDNDDLVCELCLPPLSSIEVNCERIGYAAAEMLDQMLGKAGRGTGEKLIRPTTLVRRRSTDATVVRDPFVAEAIRFIRAYACEDIDVPSIASHVGVSRRYLEQQFQRAVGRTVHTELLRVRLEHAQRLLGETDWKLQTIAERSGFKQASHLSSVFQEKLGLRPGQYRQRVQNRP
jgi:LacI family transcriptional regulator